MNKASSKCQNHRTRVAGKSFGKWKKRSKKKDDKSIMQPEVRCYKDKDLTVQDQDGSSVTRNRLTIYQGIYGHGCSSGAVCREIGFTKEGKARAEADLSRIIDLARNGSISNQSSRVLTSAVTPQRSFVVKDTVGQEKDQFKDDEGENADDPKGSKSPHVASQSSDHQSSSQSSNSKRPRNPLCKGSKEKPSSKRKNLGSKHRNILVEKENISEAVEDKLSPTEASAAEDEEKYCEILTEAIVESLDETAKKIGKVRKLNVATVRKMQSIWRYTLEQQQSHPPGVISAAFCKLEEGSHTESGEQKPENKSKKADEGSLRIPRDFLLAKHTSNSNGPTQKASVTEARGHSLLDITLHSEKNKISPSVLLQQYENDLENANSNRMRNSWQDSGTEEISCEREIINRDEMKYDIFSLANNQRGMTSNLQRVSDRTSSCHAKESGEGTPKFHNPAKANCPKTVVVNPLNFLQRYEEQSEEETRKDHCMDTGYDSPSSSVDYLMQVLSKNGQRHKLPLDTNVHMNRTGGCWTNKSSTNNYYSLDPRQVEIRESESIDGETYKNGKGTDCRKCMVNTESRVSDEQAYFESDSLTNLGKLCYPPDASIKKMNITSSHSMCNSSVPHFSLNPFSHTHPDDLHLKVDASDKYLCNSVLNQPVMHQQPRSQIQDMHQMCNPLTANLTQSRVDCIFPTVHPPGDPRFVNMIQPKESVLSTLNDNIQASGRPSCLHSQSHSICNNNEGAWAYQVDYQSSNTYSNRRQQEPSYPLTGLKPNIYRDEPCSEGSSQNSSSQEPIRHQCPHPHPTGRESNAACVIDWVDHREPQDIWQPNQITSHSGYSSPKLCRKGDPSPEERFYRRKLY